MCDDEKLITFALHMKFYVHGYRPACRVLYCNTVAEIEWARSCLI